MRTKILDRLIKIAAVGCFFIGSNVLAYQPPLPPIFDTQDPEPEAPIDANIFVLLLLGLSLGLWYFWKQKQTN